jgi:serpin B
MKRAGLRTTLALILVLTLACSASGAAGSPEDCNQKQVVKAYNQTGLELYQSARPGSKNLVLSPYSIGTAMAMGLAGARGATEQEMAEVLHQPVSGQGLSMANAGLIREMNRLAQDKEVQLATANGLCLTTNSELVQQGYKDLLHSAYQAELFEARDVGPINAWVASKTRGRIDKLLKGLSANSVCVLLNAIYFKGLWASQFSEQATRPESFYAPGGKLQTAMMHQTGRFQLVEYADFKALRLPYVLDSLSLVLVLPKARNGLPGLEEGLSMRVLGQMLRELEQAGPRMVELSLPRFKIEFEANLVPAFRSYGMQLAFSPTRADFGGITGKQGQQGLSGSRRSSTRPFWRSMKRAVRPLWQRPLSSGPSP